MEYGITAHTKRELRKYLGGDGSDLINVLTHDDKPVAILLPGTGTEVAHAEIAASLNRGGVKVPS